MTEIPKISISKDVIQKMPIVGFSGDITVVDTPQAVSAAVDFLMEQSVIGFDTETKPSFQKGRVNKMALMQLSTLSRCFLFRLNILGIHEPLAALLESEAVKKIGLSVHDDFSVMHRSSKVQPQGFVEIQNLVKEFGIQDISLQKIYAILFGEKISKSQRLTNWEARTLTPQQQRYAAIDAWACLRIYNYLESGEFDPSNSPYIVVDPQS